MASNDIDTIDWFNDCVQNPVYIHGVCFAQDNIHDSMINKRYSVYPLFLKDLESINTSLKREAKDIDNIDIIVESLISRLVVKYGLTRYVLYLSTYFKRMEHLASHFVQHYASSLAHNYSSVNVLGINVYNKLACFARDNNYNLDIAEKFLKAFLSDDAVVFHRSNFSGTLCDDERKFVICFTKTVVQIAEGVQKSKEDNDREVFLSVADLETDPNDIIYALTDTECHPKRKWLRSLIEMCHYIIANWGQHLAASTYTLNLSHRICSFLLFVNRCTSRIQVDMLLVSVHTLSSYLMFSVTNSKTEVNMGCILALKSQLESVATPIYNCHNIDYIVMLIITILHNLSLGITIPLPSQVTLDILGRVSQLYNITTPSMYALFLITLIYIHNEICRETVISKGHYRRLCSYIDKHTLATFLKSNGSKIIELVKSAKIDKFTSLTRSIISHLDHPPSS